MSLTPAPFDLTGQVALVTGAGSPTGIGFACARMLGACGARVVVSSTTTRIDARVAELSDDGVEAAGLTADLTDSDRAAEVVAAAAQRWGRLDILVNNAGMTSVSDPAAAGETARMTDEVWHAGLSRNLDTAFFVSRAALGPMLDAGYGRIVNVASITGPLMAMVGEPAYAASKAGMVGLTRALALEVARSGITVNAVCPGWIATASQSDHERDQGARTPLGRSAAPDEVASAVTWLATSSASYVTGQAVVVDGGNSIAEERQ